MRKFFGVVALFVLLVAPLLCIAGSVALFLEDKYIGGLALMLFAAILVPSIRL